MPLALSCQPLQPSQGCVRVCASAGLIGPQAAVLPGWETHAESNRSSRFPPLGHCVSFLHERLFQRLQRPGEISGQESGSNLDLWSPKCCKYWLPSQTSTTEPGTTKNLLEIPILDWKSCKYLLGYLHAYRRLNSKNCSQRAVSFGQVRTYEYPAALVLLQKSESSLYVTVCPKCTENVEGMHPLVHNSVVCHPDLRCIEIAISPLMGIPCVLANLGPLQALCFYPFVTEFCQSYLSRRVAPAWLQPSLYIYLL